MNGQALALVILGCGGGLWVFGGMMYLAFGLPGLLLVIALIATPIALSLWSKSAKAAAARRAEYDRQAQERAWMYRFEDPAIRAALFKLRDEWEAASLWTAMGMGTMPRWIGSGDRAYLDPGSWPQVVDAEPTLLGARVTLEAVAGHSLKHYTERRGQLVMGLDLADVTVTPGYGEQVVLDLKVRDPLTELHVSPLLDETTRARIEYAIRTARDDAERGRMLTEVCADLELTVPVDGLTCYDDIQLGPTEFGEMLTVNLAGDDHMAWAGTTRAGKSIGINDIIAPAMLMRDVKVVIIDPNGATSPAWQDCAHLICDTRDADKAVKVLEAVMAEIERRQPLFAKLRTDKLTEFSPDLPLWLVVIEEASNFKDNPKFGVLMEKISAQAAKYGIKLHVIAQKMSGDNVPTGARAQLSGRVTFRVNDPADYRMLFPDAPQYGANILKKAETPQGVGVASLPCHVDPVRFRALFMPTQACFVIGDLVTAARRAQRRTAAPALPTDQPDTHNSNITDTAKSPAPETKKADPSALGALLDLPELPTNPKLGGTGTVIPFDRSARTGDTTPDQHDTPTEDTGTE